MCGQPRKTINHRSALLASRKYMGDMPNLDNNVNDVSHLNEPVSDVPDLDTHVNDVSNSGRYVFDVPHLYTSVVDKLNMNQCMDDEPVMDKNMTNEPETDEHVSDESDLDKIIGGRYAIPGEAPWQVSLRINGGIWYHTRGGSIINEFWILTAAHCLVHAGKDRLRVVVGDHFLSRTDPQEQTLAIDKIIPHEGYKFGLNDIGLIKIKPQLNGKGVVFGDYVQPICLPIGDSTPSAGTDMILTGWGRTVFGGGTSDVLKLTVVPLIPIWTCPYDMYIQYGILSRSHRCQLPNFPNILTNVSFHMSWILQTIKLNSFGMGEQRLPDRPQLLP